MLNNSDEILLDGPENGMEVLYRAEVKAFINLKLITLEEWNNHFRHLRDEYGYSILHYLACTINDINIFVTICDKMLRQRKNLYRRFKVKIYTPEEFSKL